jgi:hypothetical protein
MTAKRLEHIVKFYSLLDAHRRNIGGARTLANCSGRMAWPKRGIYFFYEMGENRTDTGRGCASSELALMPLKQAPKQNSGRVCPNIKVSRRAAEIIEDRSSCSSSACDDQPCRSRISHMGRGQVRRRSAASERAGSRTRRSGRSAGTCDSGYSPRICRGRL